MLGVLHSFLEALEEKTFPASLAYGPLPAYLKPEMLSLSDHSSLVTFPSDSKLNWETFSNFETHEIRLGTARKSRIISPS